MARKVKQTEPERAVSIASVIMQRAGLCRYAEPFMCRRAQTPTDEDCAVCIEKWLRTKARSELRKEAGTVKTPAPGTHIQFGGREWVALGVEQGVLLVIAANLLPEEMPFDKKGTADWRKSSARKYLNGTFLNQVLTTDAKDSLIKFTSDLTSDDGMTDYGTCEDYVFLLSDSLYRKYRQYIPKYGGWWWTLTPWSCLPSLASVVRYVNTSGAFYYCHAYNSRGLAPSLLLNPKSLERAQSDAPASRT